MDLALKLFNDLLIKHMASLLLYDEICHLFKEYISSPNFDRFEEEQYIGNKILRLFMRVW